MTSELESNIVSVERVKEYAELPTEVSIICLVAIYVNIAHFYSVNMYQCYFTSLGLFIS